MSEDATLFLLTGSLVLVHDQDASLWRSVSPDAGPGPEPPGGGGQRMEVYDPLRASWSAVPGTGRPAQVGEASCRILPDGRFLIEGGASAPCATYDPGTNRWATSPGRPGGGGRRATGPASVIAVRMVGLP